MNTHGPLGDRSMKSFQKYRKSVLQPILHLSSKICRHARLMKFSGYLHQAGFDRLQGNQALVYALRNQIIFCHLCSNVGSLHL